MSIRKFDLEQCYADSSRCTAKMVQCPNGDYVLASDHDFIIDNLTEAGTGYSQQTLDAMVKERTELRAEIERLRAQLVEAERCLILARHAMRAPLDDWKGELERPALDAIATYVRTITSTETT